MCDLDYDDYDPDYGDPRSDEDLTCLLDPGCWESEGLSCIDKSGWGPRTVLSPKLCPWCSMEHRAAWDEYHYEMAEWEEAADGLCDEDMTSRQFKAWSARTKPHAPDSDPRDGYSYEELYG
jgi:hypothetical protein